MSALIKPLIPYLVAALMAALAAFGAKGWVDTRAELKIEKARNQAEAERRRAEFDQQIAALEGELKAAVEQARKAGQKPVEHLHGSTGPVVVRGTSHPGETACAPAPTSPPVPALAGPSEESAATADRLCLLYVGDTAEVRVDGVTLLGLKGERRALIAPEVWRLAPDDLLFRGLVNAPVESVEPLPPPVPPRPRWALRAGPIWAGSVAPDGAVLGADLRVLGPAWLSADLRVGSDTAASLQLRWELP